MEIKINIEKRHLYIFSVIIGILIGVFAVNAFNLTGTGGVPSNFGHSVDEIDWSKTINENITIGGFLSVGGQKVANSNPTAILLGDLISGDGTRDLLLKAGDGDRVMILSNGNVGIGTNAPTESLDVNGDIASSRKIYSRHNCRSISTQPLGGSGNFAVDVPNECIDNTCLIVLSTVSGSYYTARTYYQTTYAVSQVPGFSPRSPWTVGPYFDGGGFFGHNFIVSADDNIARFNGDNNREIILDMIVCY